MKKPKQKKKKPVRNDNQKPTIEQVQKGEERGEDFGGLPVRDLKKNMGCG